MYIFWTLLILLVVVAILFWILPSLMAPQKQDGIVFDQRTMQPPPEVIAKQQAKMMLDSQYESAREVVPEDFPKRVIGDCPISKPMSTDLPIVNMPISFIANGATCMLSDEPINT